MYAKQYEITLPADYDMTIIRRRVAESGHIFDVRSGLAMKAYLVRERGHCGSPVNQYAPFYLWHDVGAMAHFLVGGGGFQNIIRDFGRPVVRNWAGLATIAGPARATGPHVASRHLAPLPDDGEPPSGGLSTTEHIDREIEALRVLARREGVHTAALAIDPHHWQLVRFVLWQDSVPPDEPTTERYDVVHLSAPGLTGLPDGRVW